MKKYEVPLKDRLRQQREDRERNQGKQDVPEVINTWTGDTNYPDSIFPLISVRGLDSTYYSYPHTPWESPQTPWNKPKPEWLDQDYIFDWEPRLTIHHSDGNRLIRRNMSGNLTIQDGSVVIKGVISPHAAVPDIDASGNRRFWR